MDSKAMADSFLEALQSGSSLPAAQDVSVAGMSFAHVVCVQEWPQGIFQSCMSCRAVSACSTSQTWLAAKLVLAWLFPAICSFARPSGAGLPPPPELPLPPGLDCASAVPYQQKPIDLFKAIFEASDSDEEEDEEEAAEKEDPQKKCAVLAGGEGRSLGTGGAAPGAQNSVRAVQQDTHRTGILEGRTCACDSCKLLCARMPGQG